MSRDAVRVLHWDGRRWADYSCSVTPEGTLRSSHPQLEFAADVCELISPGLYVLAADQVTLRSEADFHATRRRVAFRTLFENRGDLMSLAQSISVFVCLAVAIFVWIQIGHVSSVAEHVSAVLDSLPKGK